MRVFLLLAVCLSLHGRDELSNEESLAVRRIADFWEEGEIQIAKSQIEEFIAQFPDSPYFDTFCAALGDLFLRENSYQTALNYYAQLREQSTIDRIFLHRMQCLYRLGWHATLADECEAFLKRTESISAEDRLQATDLFIIALYHQSLDIEKTEEARTALANRAKPFFESITRSPPSEEVSRAYAHLCYILKDFEKAANVYLRLADQGNNPEEMLFQAALLQAKFDKSLSSATFAKIAQGDSFHAKESMYNQLVLTFEQENFEEIVKEKEKWLQKMPAERVHLARLVIGKSLLFLKKYSEAAQEFSIFLESNPSSTILRTAALYLLEAAYHANQIECLDLAIRSLQEANPADSEIPKAFLAKAELLIKAEKFSEGIQELNKILTAYPTCPEKVQALFSQIHIASLEKRWASCREQTLAFVQEFPNHKLSVPAWKLLIHASSFLENKQQLSADLEQALQFGHLFNLEERQEFQLLLGKTSFELGLYKKSLDELRGLEKPDAALLSALCYRDGFQDIEAFCKLAEQALVHGASMLSIGQQKVALFNGYLALGQMQKAAEHLLGAFEAKADIRKENLLWLADFLYKEFEKQPTTAPVAYQFLSQIANSIPSEQLSIRTAKLEKYLGKSAEAVARLESVSGKEASILLGELMMEQGNLERAETLFTQADTQSGPLHPTGALQAARLQIARGQSTKAAVLLKDLALQKNLETEPAHLEAALEYIDLQTKDVSEEKKRLQLLHKLKKDFTTQTDLLAKDYHLARERFPEKNRVYEQYMLYVEAEILLSEQKELQAKELLLQLKKEVLSLPLEARIQRRLKGL